ncbi:TPA: hypothetical protein R0445_004336 [Salmonella enterica subsp. enterica serovar Hvittingfoss]|nr:hypothetical protein [Salmonella enterica subsp. enterica serovar Hvittingfoss]
MARTHLYLVKNSDQQTPESKNGVIRLLRKIKFTPGEQITIAVTLSGAGILSMFAFIFYLVNLLTEDGLFLSW